MHSSNLLVHVSKNSNMPCDTPLLKEFIITTFAIDVSHLSGGIFKKINSYRNNISHRKNNFPMGYLEFLTNLYPSRVQKSHPRNDIIMRHSVNYSLCCMQISQFLFVFDNCSGVLYFFFHLIWIFNIIMFVYWCAFSV